MVYFNYFPYPTNSYDHDDENDDNVDNEHVDEKRYQGIRFHCYTLNVLKYC